MKILYADSYSENLTNQELNGSIHSVFKKTVNIITETEKIYTLAVPSVFDGPQLIKVPVDSWLFLEPYISKKVTYQNNCLNLAGELEILLEEAAVIPTFRTLTFKEINVETLNKVKEIHLDLEKKLDTVGFYRQTFFTDIEKITYEFLITGSKLLTKSILDGDKETIRLGITKLIGLGYGLTPSGDDFLTGFCLVLNSSETIDKEVIAIFNEALEDEMKQTNLISQNQLKLAIKRQALKPIIQLINQLNEEPNSPQIEETLLEIMSIGSSSGSDILFGILEGIKVISKN
ncbi:DUF2877 domain-containing protein [Vagococcus fluvialis]|uniref:oxamate carbamoyltransferase subunit AllH family protein n=1 Tax=Vagococcus fluvialis TaxID=2738 RepID=UPI001A8E5677|nr:DUF2877 domain-containing protein [Vagococcus fluvialis]MBO0437428.1 DUF2877 domain-containing protein [Vagococcus fluvialis]